MPTTSTANTNPTPIGPAKPGHQPGMSHIVWVAMALMVVIGGTILWFNQQYVFHTPLYENGDWASDSLFVREAEHGVLLHGHYSRWGFYHPGPALFYTLAAGEALFYHALHFVPTPYNGQLISLCAAMAFFSRPVLGSLRAAVG